MLAGRRDLEVYPQTEKGPEVEDVAAQAQRPVVFLLLPRTSRGGCFVTLKAESQDHQKYSSVPAKDQWVPGWNAPVKIKWK